MSDAPDTARGKRDEARALLDNAKRGIERAHALLIAAERQAEADYSKVPGDVWCVAHGSVHGPERDPYDTGRVECRPGDWRDLYVKGEPVD